VGAEVIGDSFWPAANFDISFFVSMLLQELRKAINIKGDFNHLFAACGFLGEVDALGIYRLWSFTHLFLVWVFYEHYEKFEGCAW